MYEVGNQRWQYEADNQQWQQNTANLDTETEHSHEFGDGGINEVTGWTTVNTGRAMRPIPKRGWEGSVKTDNPFDPLKTFDDFDDEEFPPLGQITQANRKPVSRTPSKRRVLRGK